MTLRVQSILFLLTLMGLSATVVRKIPARPPTPFHLQYPAYFGNRIDTPADNPLTEEGIDLGRRLFYETSLSANNRMACASCHRQEMAFTDGKTVSEGFDGVLQERNTMSLANLLWVRHFFWDGRARGLEEQAATPLTNPHEMGQSLCVSAEKLQKKSDYPARFAAAFGPEPIGGDLIVKALSQFERTLISANSKYDQFLRGEYRPTSSEARGIDLFFNNPDPARGLRGASCGHCHGGPKTFSELYHNNGLDSLPADSGREKVTGQSYDRGRFRVATLRNIALTAPYMHDGRFRTLDEVVDHYNDHIRSSPTLSPFLQDIRLGLSAGEKKDLIAFLRLLTDSSFISDKRYSNPFVKIK